MLLLCRQRKFLRHAVTVVLFSIRNTYHVNNFCTTKGVDFSDKGDKIASDLQAKVSEIAPKGLRVD
jgi:hypothetical protein